MPPRLARLAAVLVAVALVGGAFVLRSALAGDDDGGSGGDGGGAAGDGPDGGVRLLCDEDLGDAACAALGALDSVDSLEVMTADEAVDAMTDPESPDVSYDAWATLDPWPQILDEARADDDLPPVATGDAEALASSALATLTYEEGGPDCGASVPWTCLIDAATSRSVGVPALGSASGPLVLGAASVALLGPDFDIGDATDGEVRTQLDDLLDSADGAPLAAEATDMVTQRGRYQALVTTRGQGDATADTTSGQQQGLTVLELTPAATIGAILAPLGPDGPGAVDQIRDQVTGQTVTDGLADAGWSGEAARSQGLPAPDLLYALDEEFTR